MGCVWIHDRFHDHPKVLAAGNAIGLWARAASYSAAYGTEGELTPWMIQHLCARRRDIARLVEVGMWEPVDDGGYRMVPDRYWRVNHYTRARRRKRGDALSKPRGATRENDEK